MNVAIAGYGLEGKVSYDYYVARGDTVTILDQNDERTDLPKNARAVLGAAAFSDLSDYDLVVRSPGIAPRKLDTEHIWSATNEFFARCETPIIGVTGSKGKGTTCSFIAEILRASGKNVELVGNIGRPALAALEAANKADVVVYELSSFQLWDMQRSPHTSVVLHIERDHLDIHASFDEYIAAKANIARFMDETETVYVHPSNPHSFKIASSGKAKVVRYADAKTGVSYVHEGMFYRDKKALCPTETVTLPGAHNLQNACAAIAAVRDYDVSDEAVIKGLANFTGLPHRLKFVREVDEVRYYDDSIATTPGSAIAALKAFDQPKVLILGGSGKGADYRELAEELTKTTIRRLVVIGREADRIEEALAATDVSYVRLGHTTMQAVVEECQRAAEPGDVVILSPAAASFDMFTSYSDRGDQFIAAVNEL